MSFDVAKALRRATGRAKSDVANKLVSMLLHQVSRRACTEGGLTVSDPRYIDAVVSAFGNQCLYCGRDLEKDRSAIEHLNGMNRTRLGLHIPGNVAVACRICNTEKRRDDQLPELVLASTGWESFLSHNGSRCGPECKTCAYWKSMWKEAPERERALQDAILKIRKFQKPFKSFTAWAKGKSPILRDRVQTLYRECQQFAQDKLESFTSEIDFDYKLLSPK